MGAMCRPPIAKSSHQFGGTAGVNRNSGVPSWEVDENGVVRVIKRIEGAQPFPVFEAALEGILAKPTEK